MTWHLSDRCDPAARRIADRHYNRQSDCVRCGEAREGCCCPTGYEGAPNFVPPGRCLVLRHPRAFWVTSWPFAAYVHHDWPGAWVCSAFRLEGGDPGEASALILSALAATRWRYPDPPAVPAWRIARGPHASRVEPVAVCMVTMVDRAKTHAKRDPGRCFRRAGFVEIGQTRSNRLVVLGLPVEALPPPVAPSGSQASLFA